MNFFSQNVFNRLEVAFYQSIISCIQFC